MIPIQPEDERDRAMLGKKFGTLGQRHWTMKGLPDRMRDVADLVPQTDDSELDRRYRDDNKLSNLTLHGGGTILNDRVHVHAPHHVEINAGKTPQHMPNGLRQAYWSYGRLVRVACRFISPESEARVDDAMSVGWPLLQTITLPALKHAGRNGPCPCRSGRKSKECHGAI